MLARAVPPLGGGSGAGLRGRSASAICSCYPAAIVQRRERQPFGLTIVDSVGHELREMIRGVLGQFGDDVGVSRPVERQPSDPGAHQRLPVPHVTPVAVGPRD